MIRIISSLLALAMCGAVDRAKFRTCSDTGFCRRYRGKDGPIYGTNYALDISTLHETNHVLVGKISAPAADKELNLRVSVLSSGSVRLKISEEKDRWQPQDILLPEGLTAAPFSILKHDNELVPPLVRTLVKENVVVVISFSSTVGSDSKTVQDSVLVIYSAPLKFELYQEGVLQIAVNERALMHYEQLQSAEGRVKAAASVGQTDAERHGGKEVVDYGEDGLAMYADGSKEEKRESGNAVADQDQHGESHAGHADPMIRGPISVGMDFSFPFAQHVYGIPEHATGLSLPTSKVGSSGAPSRYDEPYRMYNLDVFEYELDEPMALYGTIPLLVAHGLVEGKGRTTGMFWFNPSETFIDISDAGNPESKDTMHKESHWMSESGEIDFFLLPGPTPSAVYDQYTRLTGRQQLPPIFALGYHQCRWNYKDEKDVAAVESMFEKLDYPMDVMWLDIDHTEGNRYFTWDKSYFQTPIDMQKNLSNHGRKMVTIVDPHLKRDEGYYIHKEATAKGLYIKDKDGKDFDGWCWPGQSSYLDFTSPVVRQWWAEQFSLTKYIGSTLDLFTWNDMNEPSVFNGPEVSMNKHNLNIDGIEHREWHNLYGYYMQQATAEGLTLRSPPGNDPSLKLRPFVLTRSFWAGSQRWGAMWTGDNKAEWGHLKIAAPMLLSLNLAGLSFGGSDAGGFFGEPGAELFTRWYQAAAFTPFFRGHAHHDTKRREPWLFGEPYTSIVRTVTMVRYTLLPLWYTAFYHAYSTGQPVMRTMFSEFPDDRSTFTMDDQWLVGGSLLVKPVTDADVNAIDVYLPKSSDTDGWYDLNTLHYTPGAEEGQMVNIQAPLGSIPVFIRSGHIIPRKMRLRRSAKLMHFDPLTLVVAPSLGGSAKGALYMDDETSLAHETVGAFSYRQFRFEGNVLTCEAGVVLPSSPSSIAQATYRPPNTVERIEIAGQKSAPKRVVYRSLSKDNTQPGVELITFYDSASQMVVIKKPDGNVADDWSVTLEY